MGWLQTMGKRVALRVSSIVARNELFERYGERPVQPPLKPGTWVSPSSEEEIADEDPEPACRPINGKGVQHRMGEGPVVIHHWATWCEACIDEGPKIQALAEQSVVPVVCLSWDTFEGQPLSSCLGDVSEVSREMGWPTAQYVLEDTPQDFFQMFEMDCKQVPQTWLIDGDGKKVLSIDGPLDEQSLSALLKAAEGLQ